MQSVTRRPDPWIVGAVLIGAVLRVIPAVIWPIRECVRDECVYRYAASSILKDGVMGVTTKGWLPAPGYPHLLAGSFRLFRSWEPVEWLQIGLSIATIAVFAALVRQVAGEDARGPLAARWGAWLFALHPTLAWYPSTEWIETIYIGFLLPAIALTLRAREGRRGVALAAAAGLCMAVCVLFRGVATWLPPLFVLALLVPGAGEGWRAGARARLRPALAFVCVVGIGVAPYSLYASRTYGGFMITDATMGHVLYLGNNDFPPMTFDYGNGTLTQPLFYRTIRSGRPMCRDNAGPLRADRCDVRNAVIWARNHPGEFVARVPLRLAQQLNPNSFFTRHLRWGGFAGLPWQLKELLCLAIAGTTALVVLGGTLAGFARARGPYAWLGVGTIVYTMLSAAVSYGMTRFRLPLEPLWMVWLSLALADPRGTWSALRGSPARALGAVVVVPLLAWWMSWFALTGFPMFWR